MTTMTPTPTNAAPSLMACPLCGAEFDRAAANCSHGCPLDAYCKLIKCPHCSYEFPDERKYKNLWERLFARKRSAVPAGAATAAAAAAAGQTMAPGTMPLTQAPVDVDLELERLTCVLQTRKNSLSVYGLVPGSRLTLQQTQPTCVVRVGATELALDHDIAREVIVRRVR